MAITVMPFVLIALVGAATPHRDIAPGDRFIVTTDRLIVAGDREILSKDAHLVAGDREILSKDPHLMAGDRTWLDSHWGVVADREYRAAGYRNA